MKDKVKRILYEPRQDTIGEAIVADIIDAFPLAGITTGALRIKNAMDGGDDFAYKLQGIDMGIDITKLIALSIGKGLPIPTPINTILTIDKKLNNDEVK